MRYIFEMFVYVTIKWAGKVSKLKKQKKSSSLFSFVLKERTIPECEAYLCNGSHA
jgi:hypothetical protein